MWSVEPLWDLLISSTDGEPHINCPYLTTAIPPVTSAHLNAAQKWRFLQSASKTSLLSWPLSCQPPLLSSPTINYGLFPPGFRQTIGCFSSRKGKTPSVRSTAGPGRHSGFNSKLLLLRSKFPEFCARATFQSFVNPGCLPPLVMWVGGLLVQLGS